MLDSLLDGIFIHFKLSLVVVSLLLLAIVGLAWWNFVWQSPEIVFQDMLVNNLESSSVTKFIIGNTKTRSLKQYVRQETGNVDAVEWLVTVAQPGTIVTTDSIGTPVSGYISYKTILVPKTVKNAKTSDLRGLVNVWAKADHKTDLSLKNLFSQTLLDVGSAPLPPIADLPSTERQNLDQFMISQKIFTPAYKTVKNQIIDGQAVYSYVVSVRLEPYIKLMLLFAHDLGLTGLNGINPALYANSPPAIMTVFVNKTSHQLARITYPASKFTQNYTDWGLMLPIKLPKNTITTTSLQKRLQTVI